MNPNVPMVDGMQSDTTTHSIVLLSFTPLTAPNAIFLTIFVLIAIVQLGFAFKWWRNYGYSIGMCSGIVLELGGYAAKVKLSHSPSHKDAYIMYIIGLTLGPTFLSSSLYLCVGAVQRHYQTRCLGFMGPRSLATFFILGDFLCLCFIGVGGSLAAIYADKPIGEDLMIAGLATQVLFTAVFCVCLNVVYRSLRPVLVVDPKRWFVIGAAVAAACLFVRSCWRVAELSGGFGGPLASKEGLFIALDSIPMIIMTLVLTALHPRLWFSSGGSFEGYFGGISDKTYRW